MIFNFFKISIDFIILKEKSLREKNYIITKINNI